MKSSDLEITHQILSDPQNLGGHSLPHLATPEESSRIHTDFINNSLLSLIICLPSTTTSAQTQTPIGILTLTPSLSRCHQKQTNLGIFILPSFQRKGYGTEAVNWILVWGFLRKGLSGIHLRCFEYNQNAMKLYRRLGFGETDVFEKVAEWQGRRWDVIELGMMRDEWMCRERKRVGEARKKMERSKERWGV